MATVHPYLFFDSQCREAFEFYKECIGGELSLQTVGESPMAESMPDFKDAILHVQLKKGNLVMFGSDMMGRAKANQGNTVTICFVGENKEEVVNAFNKLSVGGVVGTPIKEEFFGIYADLTDKYGQRWMFQYSPEQG